MMAQIQLGRSLDYSNKSIHLLLLFSFFSSSSVNFFPSGLIQTEFLQLMKITFSTHDDCKIIIFWMSTEYNLHNELKERAKEMSNK